MNSRAVPYRDPETEVVSLIPLERFPHGELIGTRCDEQYDIEFYATGKNVQVLSYDETTGKAAFATPAGWSIHRGKPVELVTLANKKTIITDDDPRAIYGIAKDAKSLTPCRFTPSDALKHKVSVPCHIGDLFQKNKGGEVVEFDLWFDWDAGLLVRSEDELIEGNLITKVDFEFGQFLGCMCGDGWWDKVDRDNSGGWYRSRNAKRALNLSDNEGDNAAFVTAYLKKICRGGIHVDSRAFSADKHAGRFGDTVRYSYFGPETKTIAVGLTFLLGGAGDEETAGSANKHMPSWLLGAPSSARFGFLCGMLSTDGSISMHKHAEDPKRKPQLMSSITSTSLLLIRDINSLLNTLGMHSTIGFSKFTANGNTSWILSIASAGLKNNEKHMIGMANKRKLAILQAADIIEEYRAKSNVRIVFPDIVADVVLSYLKSHGGQNGGVIRRMADAVYSCVNDLANDTRQRKKVGYVTPAHALRIIQFAMQEHTFKRFAVATIEAHCAALAEAGCLTEDMMEEDVLQEMRACLDALFPKQNVPSVYAAPLKAVRSKLNEAAHLNRISARSIQMISSFVQSITLDYDLNSNALFREWVQNIVGGNFYWSMVTDVVKTGKVEELHDLTVPGYETYVNAEGVVLSNTINVHVPASDDAVKEAYEKLMPSSDPFSDRDQDKVVLLPKQEQILGLYTAATSDNPDTYDFDTEEDALKALKTGQVPLSANINIRQGVKMASVKENAEMKEAVEMHAKGAVRDPKTGKWMLTNNTADTQQSVEKKK